MSLTAAPSTKASVELAPIVEADTAPTAADVASWAALTGALWPTGLVMSAVPSAFFWQAARLSAATAAVISRVVFIVISPGETVAAERRP